MGDIMKRIRCKGQKLIKKELKKSYEFFMKEVNTNKNSKGYGLIRDKTLIAKEVASIASVGYGLAALIIGIENKWMKYEKGYERAKGTLNTFLQNIEGINGFYYHFINLETGKREWECEISIIDTAIFICGAITVGEYFGGEIKEKAEELYRKINWNWYRNPETNQFYMGYTPERGFWGKWDMYAEQLMLYVLGVASPTFPISRSMYDEIEKPKENYSGIEDIIYTYCGTLFTYQFSHAWIDFRNKIDEENIDWFNNSIKATKANRFYCINNRHKFKTFGENSWGLTACIGTKGYSGGYGAKPCRTNLDKENDGTISPCGAIGSIVFTPKESISAMEYYYHEFPKLWGKYGFKDSYNLEGDKPWFAKEYIGIDKGISLLMLENYRKETIWKYYMRNKYVKQGLEKLGINNKREKSTNEIRI